VESGFGEFQERSDICRISVEYVWSSEIPASCRSRIGPIRPLAMRQRLTGFKAARLNRGFPPQSWSND